MAAAKKTTGTGTKTRTKKPKTIKINYHVPGEPATQISVVDGITVAELVKNMNLDGYTISLNGNTVKSDSAAILQKDDIIRVGIKTKNN